MRASWSRLGTMFAAAAVLAGAVVLPSTLVGRRGERPIGIPAPPTVVDTVVHPPTAPVVERPPVSRAAHAPRAALVRVTSPLIAAPRIVRPRPAPVSAPAPTPASPAPAPTPAPAPAPPPPPPAPAPAPSVRTPASEPPAPARTPAKPKPRPRPTPTAPQRSGVSKPGNGYGDRNHPHSGPPGQN